MKYCINYNKESRIIDKVDEINIFLSKIESLEALSQFCEEHIKQRINVCIEELDETLGNKQVESLLEFQKEHQNYNLYIRFPNKNEELGILLNKYENAKFYFDIKVND